MTAINSNRAIRGPVTAVPVVAGKGVRLVADTENNRWIVEADETVLWDGNGTGSTSVTLSEAPTNFERLRFTVYRAEGTGTDSQFELYFPAATKYFELFISLLDNSETYRAEYISRYQLSSLTLSLKACRHYYAAVDSTSWNGTGNNQPISLLKVVGINRVASN
jgi:hypothetical protein